MGTVGASYAILPHGPQRDASKRAGSSPSRSDPRAGVDEDETLRAGDGPARSGPARWEEVGLATPCLRCIFEQAPPPGLNPTCDTAGVIGPAVSIGQQTTRSPRR